MSWPALFVIPLFIALCAYAWGRITHEIDLLRLDEIDNLTDENAEWFGVFQASHGGADK